ncbi:hypothetical protein C0J52_18191 [Blattella germanica]|nr:hypothetical protein C0J52_18191 [Blattella germanica]
MVAYTFEEYTEMLIIYGKAGGNGRAAQSMYHERFFHHPTPSHTILDEGCEKLVHSYRKGLIVVLDSRL